MFKPQKEDISLAEAPGHSVLSSVSPSAVLMSL